MTRSGRDADSVVIDSNVWISALVFGGPPRQVIETAVRYGVPIVTSAEILSEVRRILRTTFDAFSSAFDALLAVLGPHLVGVELGAVTIRVCRDADDDRVLETAVLGNADRIVTGDRDLLSLVQYNGIRVVTPATWLESFGRPGPSARGDARV